MRPISEIAVVVVILVVIAAVVSLFILGPLATPPGNTDTNVISDLSKNTVVIGTNTFTPSNLTIKMGSSVTWTNPVNSSNVNSVISDATANGTAVFYSGTVMPGQNFTYTFGTAGIFTYHSGVQFYLKGVIRVALPDGTVPGPNQTVSTGNASVEMVNITYSPSPLNVSVGTTVTWYNNDSMVHSVTVISGPELFNSGYIQIGDSYSHTFGKPGIYNYSCIVHPFMFGQIVVK